MGVDFGGAVDSGGLGGGLGAAGVVGPGTLQLPLSHLNKGELFFREGLGSVNTLPNKRWGHIENYIKLP